MPGFIESLITALLFPPAKKIDNKNVQEMGIDMLKDLAKPGVISSLLKNIVNVLRTRFPAFVGTNALYSLTPGNG